MTKEIRFDQNNDGLISDDEASFYLSGHDSYSKVIWILLNFIFNFSFTHLLPTFVQKDLKS